MTKVKMSLANVQGKLSRTEMKSIMGGTDVLQCAWKNASGNITYGNCTGALYQCQTYANSYCASHSQCASVTCGYATVQNLIDQGN